MASGGQIAIAIRHKFLWIISMSIGEMSPSQRLLRFFFLRWIAAPRLAGGGESPPPPNKNRVNWHASKSECLRKFSKVHVAYFLKINHVQVRSLPFWQSNIEKGKGVKEPIFYQYCPLSPTLNGHFLPFVVVVEEAPIKRNN